MGTITIHPPIEIFDHDKYCFTYDLDGNHECQWISDLNYCGLFDVEDMEVEQKPIRTVKCPQCKEYYKKAKSDAFDRDIENSPEVLESLADEAEEGYLKKGLASADKFIDKMKKIAPSVLGDKDQ